MSINDIVQNHSLIFQLHCYNSSNSLLHLFVYSTISFLIIKPLVILRNYPDFFLGIYSTHSFVYLFIIIFLYHSMEYWRPKICYLVLLLRVVVLILRLSNWANGVQQVPCYFIFGDSLYDNGNNNNLPTRARANYLPYGIDLPGGPTGRFSNGRNLPDVISTISSFLCTRKCI